MHATKVVIATRHNADDFFKKSATGLSLQKYQNLDIDIQLFTENKIGLPKIYNSIINESINKNCNLIFMHDDIHIVDFHWISRIDEGLKEFDFLGVAGCTQRHPRQPSWFFKNDRFEKAAPETLCGSVGHGKSCQDYSISQYGPSKKHVKLLDGLILCANSAAFLNTGIRFDTQFDFHFYDLDICRQAEEFNLSMGTWDISLIHESGGNFNSESWHKSKELYYKKWGEL